MKCPKCGGEIPLFDLRPNCKHCGVNIMYYTQNEGLMRDAKRTELESASARMIVARIKAEFIGGKLQIIRMIAVVAAACALMIPFGGIHLSAVLFDKKISLGLIGLIQSFNDGILLKIPAFLGSALFAGQTALFLIPAAFFAAVALLDVFILAVWIVGFLNLTKCARIQKNASLIGAIVSAAAQISVIAVKTMSGNGSLAAVYIGFGALASFAIFVLMFILNRALLKKGIEPVYRENDIKRKELLKKVRAGEVNLDDLPVPVFESEEERAERLKALEEALKAEEEGKEV